MYQTKSVEVKVYQVAECENTMSLLNQVPVIVNWIEENVPHVEASHKPRVTVDLERDQIIIEEDHHYAVFLKPGLWLVYNPKADHLRTMDDETFNDIYEETF